MERFRPLPPLLSPGGAFFSALPMAGLFLLCAVSRCKALQGVLTPRLYSYTPAHFTQLCEPIRAPWAIIACLSRFTLCCELAGDRRSGERDAGAYQARQRDADAGEPERDARTRDGRTTGSASRGTAEHGRHPAALEPSRLRAWIRIPLADANRDPHILVSIC